MDVALQLLGQILNAVPPAMAGFIGGLVASILYHFISHRWRVIRRPKDEAV